MECELLVFRHSLTKKGDDRGKGSHLSEAGVMLAGEVGGALGKMNYVCTSDRPRSMETALAMGFAVDETVPFSCGYIAGEFEHHEQWAWQRPYTEFDRRVADRGTRLSRLALEDKQVWTRIASQLPDGGRALIISHGGSIEPVLVACCEYENFDGWGKPFAHCDGVSLSFNGVRFSKQHFRRVAEI
jgi:broad specificity phosphatase PhoE